MLTEIEDVDKLRKDAISYIDESLEKLGVSAMEKLSQSHCMQLKKADLAHLAQYALVYLYDLTALTSDYRDAPDGMKVKYMESQHTVIKLQSELLTRKNDELEALKSTVKSTVENSVKSEFVSYSSVLQKGSNAADNVIDKHELKKVVQNVVQEEDRGRNLMIFGLPDEPNEDLDGAVNQLFTAIGEKPRVDACRLGRKKSDKIVRPVKVTAASSTVVEQILSKAKKLKEQERYKDVYMSPDRSPEQRLKQKQLVAQLKQLAVDKPGQRHFIRNGKIFSEDKTKLLES